MEFWRKTHFSASLSSKIAPYQAFGAASRKKWRHFQYEPSNHFLSSSKEVYVLWRHFVAFSNLLTMIEA